MAGEPHGEAAFEHEDHGVFGLVRLELGGGGAGEGLGVRPVGGAVLAACPPSNQGSLWYKKAVLITLTPEQEAWCSSHVASGDFASVEEAARQLIDERIAERAAEESDDLSWTKPYVDEARAAVARGEFVSLEEHEAHNASIT